MSLAKFRAASEAAEGWPAIVAMLAPGKGGRRLGVDMAMKLLMPSKGIRHNLQDSYRQHIETLDQAMDQLAALSDGLVKWNHGRGMSAIARVPSVTLPHVWTSAHEAAAGIARMALILLAEPFAKVTDPAEQVKLAKKLLARRSKALVITSEEVADLQARIRRERAKLLAGKTKRGAPTDQNDKRNAWVVKQRKKKKKTLQTILNELQHMCVQEGWKPVSSVQAIQSICNRHPS
jgi:hypothetical protein